VKFEVLARASIKMAVLAASTSETSINFYQTTQRNNPEDSHLLLKSYGHNLINTGYKISWKSDPEYIPPAELTDTVNLSTRIKRTYWH
jgi:hypothetical protein